MMSRKYRIIAIVISICFLLSSCLELDTYRYYGNDISLAVASRESILGVYGHYQDKTIILEIDDQGRIMYGFLGTAMWYGKYVIAIGIVQEVSDNYVFYYDGYNILSQIYSGSTSDLLNKELIYSFFDEILQN
jgi:predicted small secreted protein